MSFEPRGYLRLILLEVKYLLDMILKQSVLYRTGQAWKCRAMLGLLIMGFFTFSFTLGAISYLGLALFAFGFATGVIGIRCPSCGVRWLWAGISNAQRRDWGRQMLTSASCPACGEPRDQGT
jgi:hypothetical protein